MTTSRAARVAAEALRACKGGTLTPLRIFNCSNVGTSSAARTAAEALRAGEGAFVLRGNAAGTSPQEFGYFGRELSSFFPEFATPCLKYDSGHRYELAPGVTNSASDLPEVEITPHCEHQDMPRSPVYVAFACETPPDSGGRTPVYDLREVKRRLEATQVGARLLRDLRQEGVRVIRFYPSVNDPLAKIIVAAQYPRVIDKFPDPEKRPADWKAVVESFQRHNITHMFEPGSGSLRMSWHNPGFAKHPFIPEHNEVFFYGFGTHGCYFDEQLPDVPLTNRPFHNQLGNGKEFSLDQLQEVKEAFSGAALRFEWQRGDILMCDNFLFAHGRDPYEGNRSIMAQNGNAVHWAADGHISYETNRIE